MLTKKNTITSREIAELMGKEHKNVMRDIRNMEEAWVKVNGRKFELVEYTDGKGEKRPMYELTKSECLYVATKFNDEARAKLVIRWEQLEAENKPVIDFTDASTVLRLAQNWAEEQAKRMQLEATIEIQKPKVEYVDKVLASNSSITTTVIAKELGMSAHSLNALLNKLKVQFFAGGVWVLYAKYQGKGYTKTKTHTFRDSQGTLCTHIHTVWTEAGRMFIHQLLKEWHREVDLIS